MEGKIIMEDNKNTPAPEQTPAETTPAETTSTECGKSKLTGDNRTLLIAFLTSVIVVIAYHMTMEAIKFFNEDEFRAMHVPVYEAPRGEHHHGGPRHHMKKKWKFRHFKDCKYFCDSADCDQKPMKDCKCMERYKEIRAKRRAERRAKMQRENAAAVEK